jgi:acetyl esterase
MEEMVDTASTLEISLDDCFLSDEEARELIAGGAIMMTGGRSMDAKAQIVGTLFKSIRPPDTIPTPDEAREQLRQAVEFFGEASVPLARREDTEIPGPAGPMRCRIYDPVPADRDDLRPVLLFLHGGGWVQGDLDTHDAPCARIAASSDQMVLALDYRLAPEHKFPAAFHDVLAAFRWLRENGGEIGADPSRIAVGGDSAGANLAAALCQSCAAEQLQPPACQVLIYPALDLKFDSDTHRAMPDDCVLPRARLRWYAEQYLASPADADDVRVSPLRAADLHAQPPALIITCGFDPLRGEGELYAARLAQAGCDVTYHEYPGQIHAFIMLAKAIPAATTCLREVGEYLRRQFV